MSFDLTNKNIKDTFQNLLQKTGSDGRLYDLEGNKVRDLTIDGTLTANTYVTSQSIVNTSSGSTAFGNSADDTHLFTGHITASGDISSSAGTTIQASTIRGNTRLKADRIVNLAQDEPYLEVNNNHDVIIGDPQDAVNATKLSVDDTNNRITHEAGSFVFSDGFVDITANTDATDASGDTGILRVEGGVSIAKKVFAGTFVSSSQLRSSNDIVATTHITASGNISSSGKITANEVDINGGTIDGITSLTAGGNLDIGNHDFRCRDLTVDGADLIIGDNNASSFRFMQGGAGHLSLRQANDSSVIYLTIESGDVELRTENFDNAVYVDDSTQQVGIGTSKPAKKLTVAGDISASGDLIIGDLGGGTYISMSADGAIEISGSGEASLDVNGDITASGDISSSGTVSGVSGSFPNATIGTTSQVAGMRLTVDGDISASGKLFVKSDNTFGAGAVIGRESNLVSNLHFSSGSGPYGLFLSNVIGGMYLYSGSGAIHCFSRPGTGHMSLGGVVASNSDMLTVKGNISASGDLRTGGGQIILKNSGSRSNIKFYCESNNAHFQTIMAAPHSDAASNILTLPSVGTVFATTDGAQTFTNKTLTSPDINTPDIDGGTIDNTVIGGTTKAAGSFTTVTASGNISSSGTIFADTIKVENKFAVAYDGTEGVRFAYANNQPIQIGKSSSNPTTIEGHITASGNISASGKYVGEVDLVDTSADAVKYITLGDGTGGSFVQVTNGLAFNPSSDTLNLAGDKIILHGAAGHITASGVISASGGFIGDGSQLTGLSSAAISSYTNNGNDRVVTSVNGSTVNAEANLTFDGSKLTVTGQITSSGTISASGGFVGDGSQLTGLSSAAISSYTNNGDNRVVTSVNSNTVNAEANLTFDGSKLTVDGEITASGNISASGAESKFRSLRIDAGQFMYYDETTNFGWRAFDSAGGRIMMNKIGGVGGLMSMSGSSGKAYVGINTGVMGGHANEGLTVKGMVSASSGVHGYRHFTTGSNIITGVGRHSGGDIAKFGGGTLTAGKMYYLNTSGVWSDTDASDNTAGADELLGIALGANPSTDGVLLRGIVSTAGVSNLNGVGRACYMSTTANLITEEAPSGNNEIVRVVGYVLNANDTLYFNPSSVWVKVTA